MENLLIPLLYLADNSKILRSIIGVFKLGKSIRSSMQKVGLGRESMLGVSTLMKLSLNA
jgi:hypothetical protein